MTSRVSAVGPETSLADIARILAAGHFGGVPVVTGDARVTGFVSESDVMDALLDGRGPDARAADIMSTPVVTVDEFDRLEEVMRVLREHGIHHLPVVRQGRLVGIITPSDLIRFLVEELLPVPPAAG
jgi:CBS domain-containing protein